MQACSFHAPCLCCLGWYLFAAALAAADLNVASAQGAAQFKTQWQSGRGNAVANAARFNVTAWPHHCELAVIGAGWGGAYFAWRLAVDGKILNASSVCVFEANGRVGGRVYSVHGLPGMQDMAIDVGGYRFIETDLLSSQLVWDALKLPTACYDYECKPATRPFGSYIIKDAYGNNAGYATPIETMLGQLEDLGAGQQVFFGKELTGIYPEDSTANKDVRLQFSDGTAVSATQVLANIPRNALENLDRKSLIFEDATRSTREYLKNVTVNNTVKVYAIYEDAWWNSKLGLVQGTFTNLTDVAPFQGRYHDGAQKCIIGKDTAGMPIYSGRRIRFGNCTGALEVMNGLSGQFFPYYLKFMASRLQPLTVVTNKEGDHESYSLIRDIHAHLISYHADALRLSGVEPSSIQRPSAVVLANWIPQGPFTPSFGAFGGGNVGRAAVRRPVPGYQVFVANQDYGYGQVYQDGLNDQGWAIASLIMAEKVLQAEIGIAKPVWLNESWYMKHVVEPNRASTHTISAASQLHVGLYEASRTWIEPGIGLAGAGNKISHLNGVSRGLNNSLVVNAPVHKDYRLSYV